MPRNSSGEYTLPAGNPVVSDTLIETGWANPTMSDIAAALSDSLSRSGSGGMLAPFRINDGTVTAPGIAFSSQTNLGLYRSATDTLSVAAGGQQVAAFNVNGITFAKTVTAVNGAFTGPVDVMPSADQAQLNLRAPAGQIAILRCCANGAAVGSTLTFDMMQDEVGNASLMQRANLPLSFYVNQNRVGWFDSAAFTLLVPQTLPGGALATPSLNFIGDPDTGIWHPTDGTVAISSNGVEMARFVQTTSSFTNAIAIQGQPTVNPQMAIRAASGQIANLFLCGGGAAAGVSSYEVTQAQDGTGYLFNRGGVIQLGANNVSVGTLASNGFTFTVPALTLNTVPPNTDAVIEARAPAGKASYLHLSANAGAAPFSIYQTGNGQAVISQTNAAQPMFFYQGGVERFRIGPTGTAADTQITASGQNINVVLNAQSSGKACSIISYTASLPRWGLFLNQGDAEGGGNTGSTFALTRYADAGTGIDNVITARRDTGQVIIPRLVLTADRTWTVADDANNRIINFNTASGDYIQYEKATKNFYIVNNGQNWQFQNSDGKFIAKDLLIAGTTDFHMFGSGPTRSLMFLTGWQWNFNSGNGDLTWVGASANHTMLRADKAMLLYTGQAYKTGGGPWTDISDARIKQNIRAYMHGLAEVLQLEPRVFNFIPETGRDPAKDYVGLIAQEAQVPMPEMVSTTELVESTFGVPVDLGVSELLQLDPNALTYALINAVKDLVAMIEALDVRITNLEGAI